MILLFDAANTLIHKPQLFENAKIVLNDFGYGISIIELKKNHKIISELITFPDRTNKEFYDHFNYEWLCSLGIIPNEELLNSLFSSCSYLPWEKFEDTKIIEELNFQKAILSNFSSNLKEILDHLFPDQFSNFSISENEKYRKPDHRFFEKAIENLNVKPKDILFIGDSLKLDIIPAQKLGINAWLIDRNNDYPVYKKRLNSLLEIKMILQK